MLRKAIRMRIMASGLSGREIEVATGISKSVIRSFLAGEKSLSSNKIEKLMDVLGMHLVAKSASDIINEAKRNV